MRSTQYFPYYKEGQLVDLYWDHQTEDPKSYLGQAHLVEWIPRRGDGLSYVLEEGISYAKQEGFMSECWRVRFVPESITPLGKHYIQDPDNYRAIKRYKILLSSAYTVEEESILDKVYNKDSKKRRKRAGRKTIYRNLDSNKDEIKDHIIKWNGKEIF